MRVAEVVAAFDVEADAPLDLTEMPGKLAKRAALWIDFEIVLIRRYGENDLVCRLCLSIEHLAKCLDLGCMPHSHLAVDLI